MPKNFFKRLTRNGHELKKHPNLQFFGKLLHDPNLWHLNRRSSAGGMALGLFCAFIPMPMQMLISAALAILLRVNLPIAVAMVWFTNPLTIPPMFYAAYKLGAWILNEPVYFQHFEASGEWLMNVLDHIWAPLLLGSFLTGLGAALVGYVMVQILWRLQVIRGWRRRREERRAKKAAAKAAKATPPDHSQFSV